MAHHLAALDELTGLEVVKAHATGNDFVMLVDPAGDHDLRPDHVAALCDRRLGIGGDGLIRAVPAAHDPDGRRLLEQHREEISAAQEGTPQTEAPTVWFMDYRNGDGSEAEMCGNGVRAFAHLLVSDSLVELDQGQELVILTRAGVRTMRRVPEGYSVGMGIWSFIDPELARAEASDALVMSAGLADPRPALSISMGNPHTVVALPDDDALEQLDLTTAPGVEPVPRRGTNVEFVVPAEPLVDRGVGAVRMRVHERGVGETMSCGTGACAAAAAVRVWASGDGVDTWDVSVLGGVVRVRFSSRDDGAEDVELSGPAEIVARMTLS
ncbi:diaminopimelate epimerase [Nesterenkonia marinintestina]|uniref:diaminopimelate epimerase n=1 Tax=Nesterenkonia marinintestina TaxID=2979865 RepID=UPI0021C017B0|nr:diaminopimelate epimerase [Nesterenkonia sp. GX14115]